MRNGIASPLTGLARLRASTTFLALLNRQRNVLTLTLRERRRGSAGILAGNQFCEQGLMPARMPALQFRDTLEHGLG